MKQKMLALVVALAAIGSVVALSSKAGSQDSRLEGLPGVPAHRVGAGAAASAALSNHALTGTFLDVNPAGASTSCGSAGCVATPATIFSEHIKCLGAAGTKCVFQITMASQNLVNSNDPPANPGEEGVYQFLVDGAPPNPGPTGVGGFYFWTFGQGAAVYAAVSTAVTASVTNSTANQSHSISVGVSCEEILGDGTGCFEATSFSNLQIARYN